jgi:TRAP-type C4-dicarboxylate transport system permease small subunit
MDMERGLVMCFHTLIIAILLYIVMKYGLKQSSRIAEDRTILISSLILVYMILFGHGLPMSINKNIIGSK